MHFIVSLICSPACMSAARSGGSQLIVVTLTAASHHLVPFAGRIGREWAVAKTRHPPFTLGL